MRLSQFYQVISAFFLIVFRGFPLAENKIYAFNENLIKDSEFDPYNETYEINSSFFDKGEILDLGGRYDIHYALVKN